MPLSEFEIKRLKKIVGRYIEENRLPADIRNEVDLAFRIEGQSVVIFEIRPFWNDPRKKLKRL